MKPLSLLATAITLLLATATAQAQDSFVTPSGKTVYRSGNTYYINACDRPSHFGELQCFAKIVTDAQGNPFASTSPTSGYLASDLQSAYGVTPANAVPGQVVGIVVAYHHPKLESWLATYRSTMKLGDCTVASGCLTIVTDPNFPLPPQPPLGSNWGTEAALDTQMVSAMCPTCRIRVYEATSPDSSYMSKLVALAVQERAGGLPILAISNSYGTTESTWFADTGIADDAARYQSPDGGMAIVFASGDTGYSSKNINCPACLNTVLAVGGTTLKRTTTGRLWSETAWSKSGSGCAKVGGYGAPSWMRADISQSACPRRMVADVSAMADPATGAAVYAPCGLGAFTGTSSWCVVGGTSAAAPIWAGIIGAHGPIAAYPSPCNGVTSQNKLGCLLYYAASSQNGSGAYSYNAANTQLWDVTSGSTGSCTSSVYCKSGPGYDGPTGLGTPKGTVLTLP